jgi:uncharacterized protein DUF4242
VTTFVVERTLPGLTEKHLVALRKALGEASRRLSRDGEPIRYIQSNYEGGRARCICTFEASSRAAVIRVNEVAQVPFLSIRSLPDEPD